VSAGRGRTFHGPRVSSVTQVLPRRRVNVVWVLAVFFVMLALTAASGDTARGRIILAAIQRFLLFYSGVFALIALTAAVGVGLAAADRIVMMPPGRVVAQGVHRAVSLSALAFLIIHIVTEILASRASLLDAFVPFLARGRTFYIGLGTVASDLLVILIVTGIARGRFATKSPWTWRAIHATAYLCWLLSLVHGLLAGRTAKPYVDWSYGACVAAVGLALLVRLVASVRDRRETAPHPVPDRAMGAGLLPPSPPPMSFIGQLPPAPQTARMPRALPSGPVGGQRRDASRGTAAVQHTGELPVAGQHTGPQRAVKETAVPEVPPYSPPLQPLAAYQEPYSGDPYADSAYATGPYPDDAYGDPSYAGVPYPDGMYPRPDYAEGFYPDGTYAEPGYAGAPYPGDADADMPYPGDPYAQGPYGAGPFYPGNPYGAGSYPEPPGQGLWPDHPSWPSNGIADDASRFRQAPDPERL
jgi:DMSO/TMAO reductase YedYZ heme-binding membrane subunit